MNIIEHFSDFSDFFGRDQAFWWENGALRKSILEGIQIHNEQKPG